MSNFHDKEAHSIVEKLRRIEPLLPPDERKIAILLLACWEHWGFLMAKEKSEAGRLFQRFRVRASRQVAA